MVPSTVAHTEIEGVMEFCFPYGEDTYDIEPKTANSHLLRSETSFVLVLSGHQHQPQVWLICHSMTE